MGKLTLKHGPAQPVEVRSPSPVVQEKIVYVDREVVREVEKLVHVPVEKIIHAEPKIVERVVEVPVDRIVDRVVERIVEVPYETVRIVEKPIIVRHNVEVPRITVQMKIPPYVWGIITVEALAILLLMLR